jgi:hypothetical protein
MEILNFEDIFFVDNPVLLNQNYILLLKSLQRLQLVIVLLILRLEKGFTRNETPLGPVHTRDKKHAIFRNTRDFLEIHAIS